MSTAIAERTTGLDVGVYRFTIAQFEKMVDAGVFPDGLRVELLDGRVVVRTKHEPHSFCVGAIGDSLRPFLTPEFHLREEKSSRSGRYWLPEPDIAIARGARVDYRRRRQPELRQLVLVVEVADTTYATDRGVKWLKYAASRIPVYWIVRLPKNVVEVHTRPAGKGASARYRECDIFGREATVPIVIDGVAHGNLDGSSILP